MAIQTELRRIGVNLNQMARALNTEVMEGRVLDLQLTEVRAFRDELRGRLSDLRAALAGNLDYWEAAW
nr:plasmid mobilization relaxosome protein MobC [Phenylobacterium haematophilum]